MVSCRNCQSELSKDAELCNFCGTVQSGGKKFTEKRAEASVKRAQKAFDLASKKGANVEIADRLMKAAMASLEQKDYDSAGDLADASHRAAGIAVKRARFEALLKAAEEKIAGAKQVGADVPKAEEALKEARQLFVAGDLEGIPKLIKDASRVTDSSRVLSRAKKMIAAAKMDISYARERGASVAKATEYIAKADEALSKGDFAAVAEMVKWASRAAQYGRKYARASQLLTSFQSQVDEAKEENIDVSEATALMDQARKALKAGLYADMQKYLKAAKTALGNAEKLTKLEASIEALETRIEQETREGSDVSEATPLLEQAWSAARENRFPIALGCLRKIRGVLSQAQKRRMALESISSLEQGGKDLQAMGAETSRLTEVVNLAREVHAKDDFVAVKKLVSKGKRIAWDAKRKREKDILISTVEKIVEKAGKGGVSAIGARELLVEVEKAIAGGHFADIETMVEAKFQAEAAKKENEALRRISSIQAQLTEFKNAEIDVSEAESALSSAQQAIKDGKIWEIDGIIAQAEEMARGLRDSLRKVAQETVAKAREPLEKLSSMEIEVPEGLELLKRSERCLDEGREYQALEFAKAAVSIAEKARRQHFEELARKDIEKLRGAEQLKRAGERIRTLREFILKLKKAGVPASGLEEALRNVEASLQQESPSQIDARLSVVEQIAQGLTSVLKRAAGDAILRAMKKIDEMRSAGMDLDSVDELLTSAKNALEAQNFDEAIEHAKAAEDEADEARKTKQEEEIKAQMEEMRRASTQFVRVKRLIDELRKAGIDISGADDQLGEAEKALQQKEWARAEPILREMEETSSNIKGTLISAARDFIARARASIATGRKLGVDVPEATSILASAEEMFHQGRYDEAVEFAKLAERKAKGGAKKGIDEARAEVQEKVHSVMERMRKLRRRTKDLDRADISIEGLDDSLKRAEDALEQGSFDDVDAILRPMEEMAEDLAARFKIAAEDLLDRAKSVIEEATRQGLSAPRAAQVLDVAHEALRDERYVEVLEYGRVIEDIVEEARRLRRSEVALDELDVFKFKVEKARELGLDTSRVEEAFRVGKEAASAGDAERAEEQIDKIREVLEHTVASRAVSVEDDLKSLEASMLEAANLGVDVERTKEKVQRAKEAVKEGDLRYLRELIDSVRSSLEEARGKHALQDQQVRLRDLGKIVEMAKKLGAEVAQVERRIGEVAEATDRKDTKKAEALLEEAEIEAQLEIQKAIRNRQPRLVVEFPEGGLQAGTWNRYVVQVENRGDLAAKNVDLRLIGEVEVKGLQTIPEIGVGEKKIVEIGIKPKAQGSLPLGADVLYERYFDDTKYQSAQESKIQVAPKGTYLVEDVFLVHFDGRLIAHETRKIREEIDEDIFSGMLTIVQDFVKDSFRQRTKVGLKRLEFGDSKIIIERGQHVYLASVVLGEEPSLLPLYMAEVIREIEATYGSALERWSGLLSELPRTADVIKRLIFVTDSREAETPAMRQSAVSSAMKLMEGARAIGVDTSEMEELLERARGELERDISTSWRLIEEAVSKAMVAQQELRKNLERALASLRSSIDDIRAFGGVVGEMERGIDEAAKAMREDDLETAKEILSGVEASLRPVREEIVSRRIDAEMSRLAEVLRIAKEEGIDVVELQRLLSRAQESLKTGELRQVKNNLDRIDKSLNEAKKVHVLQRSREEIDILAKTMEEAERSGISTAEAMQFLERARSAVQKQDIHEVDLLLGKARRATLSLLTRRLSAKAPAPRTEAKEVPQAAAAGAFEVRVDDASLRNYIEVLKRIEKAVNRARGKAGIQQHWPVRRIAIRSFAPEVREGARTFQGIILSHSNAKELDILKEGDIWKGVDLKMEVNQEALAKAYKVWAKKIDFSLRSQDPWKIKTGVEKGSYDMGVEGQVVKILPSMVSFTAIVPPHVIQQEFEGGVLYMDTMMTPEIKAEGFANEIVRIIMDARYEMGIDDKVQVEIGLIASTELTNLLSKWKDYICKEANCKSVTFLKEAWEEGYAADCEISDEAFTLCIRTS